MISLTGNPRIAFLWSGVEYVLIYFRKIWKGRFLMQFKMSLIQIMIDNYDQIFGNDDIFSKHTDKRSEDLKT